MALSVALRVLHEWIVRSAYHRLFWRCSHAGWFYAITPPLLTPLPPAWSIAYPGDVRAPAHGDRMGYFTSTFIRLQTGQPYGRRSPHDPGLLAKNFMRWDSSISMTSSMMKVRRLRMATTSHRYSAASPNSRQWIGQLESYVRGGRGPGLFERKHRYPVSPRRAIHHPGAGIYTGSPHQCAPALRSTVRPTSDR